MSDFQELRDVLAPLRAPEERSAQRAGHREAALRSAERASRARALMLLALRRKQTAPSRAWQVVTPLLVAALGLVYLSWALQASAALLR